MVNFFMGVLYQVKRELLTGFLDFFWVPRVLGPAGRAEPEVGDRNHVGFEASGVALMATGGCSFGVHISIRGKTRQTEGDFSDFVWGFVRLILF